MTSKFIQQPDGSLKSIDDPTSVAPDKGVKAPSNSQAAVTVPGQGGKSSYVNKRGQRIFEGDAGYNPSESGTSGFINISKTTTPSPSKQEGDQLQDGGGEDIDPKDKLIDDLQNENGQLRTAADEIKTAAFEGFQRFHDMQAKQYDDLDKRLGGMSSSIRDIIGGVEDKTGNPVVVDEEFIRNAEKLRDQFGTNDEQFTKFVEDMATNNARNDGRGYKQQYGNVGGADGTTMAAGQEQQGATVVEMPRYTMDDFSKLSPEKATGRLLELLNNPEATSEEILLGVMMMEMAGADTAAAKTQAYLEKSAERTKTYQKEYANMLANQKQDLLTMQQEQTKMITQQHDTAIQEILDRKASTMEDLTDKRSRLEGYMKAKLKAAGVLDGTFGLNKLVTSVTKFDALMVNSERGFAKEIRDTDNARTEVMLALTKELVTISHSYDQKLLEVNQQQNERLDTIGLAALKSADEQDAKKMSAFASFSKDFLANRAEREKVMREALEKAQERLREDAKIFTENSGIAHTVVDGEVMMIFNDDGVPIKTWDRIKEENKDQWEREKFGANYNLQVEKEEYNQWESSAKLALDRQYKAGQMNISQYKAELLGLKEQRDQETYTWERSDDYAKEGIPRWEQSDLFSRTDRHNNPIEANYGDMTISTLKKLGLTEGVDFWRGSKSGGQTKLDETPVKTDIPNVYGEKVTLTPTVAESVKRAQGKLSEVGIDLKIGDSYRSTAVQRAAYDSGKEGVAPPGRSFHELGQAIDLSQKEGDKMNDPRVFSALKEAGLQQHPNEWWHWSYGEFAGESEGNTIAFRDIDTGMRAAVQLLGDGLIAERFGKQGSTERKVLVQEMERILQEEGKKIIIAENASASALQEVYNRMIPEWRQGEITRALYGNINQNGVSQGAFKSMTPSGNIEPELPVWETLNLNRFGQKYNATKEDMTDLKTLWAQQKQQGVSLARFQDWVKGMLASGRGAEGASAATPAIRNAPVAAPAASSDSAAAFLGF